MSEIIHYLSANAAALQEKTLEHISLTIVSLLLASSIAIPLGILITQSRLLRSIILKFGSITQTI
ncbi:MAG: choline ABC transporter permease, partial [Pseudomonadota bacterium]|nr:choline ABC transporter permease [Pseudomonadota bacterium]